MLNLLYLLLPIAAGASWYSGYKYRKRKQRRVVSQLRQHYFQGLQYLINEQPDKAVDVFVKLLEVDSDTVETHLALGSLFRRRGEVDRAIRIHQNIIARPQLDKTHRSQALAELGQDYWRAGVLDRAERLFQALFEMDEQITLALSYLLKIYVQQKDWHQAIQVAEKLALATKENQDKNIAHFYCELAHDKNVEAAEKLLKQALTTDKNCVRASLMLAAIEAERGDYQAAIKYYKQVQQQDPDFISEMVRPLAKCYETLDNEIALINYLEDCLQYYPRISIVLVLSDYLRKLQGDQIAIEFIEAQCRRFLSLRGIRQLINLYLINAKAETRDKLNILKNLVEQLLAGKPAYQCVHCGFQAKSLFWICPGCKNWGAVKPIHGLIGD